MGYYSIVAVCKGYHNVSMAWILWDTELLCQSARAGKGNVLNYVRLIKNKGE